MKIRINANGVRLAMVLLLGLLSSAAAAEDTLANAGDEKPFAEARLVLQLSEGGADDQSMVLNIANNLIKHYGGPDFVDIEIVAFGPGIELLHADNANLERISSLAASGVRFVGCMNTVSTIERSTGTKLELNPVMIPVQTGVAHLVERAGQGYFVVRP
jgi:intracellular sulfur oxidation DsrE/DsrF family protein